MATEAPLPVELAIRQGEHTGNLPVPRLGLRVDRDKRIYVTAT